MSSRYRLQAGEQTIQLSLDEETFTHQLDEVLPVTSRVSRWGEEIYFPLPIQFEAGNSLTREVDVGDVVYWPEGNSLALFFGPTPMSDGDRPVPADDVVPVGTVQAGLPALDRVEAGDDVRLQRSETGG